MDGEHQTSLRFIKKIPPSGGPPAFKLTLPHQIVNRSLQHFVDADFELASSVSTQQTWQGSIAPRRNKDRSEYILQGWKLFAEAHRLQAGDQVSFELAGSRRLVVKCIQAAAAGSRSLVRRTPDDASLDEQPLKASKGLEAGSPSSRTVWTDETAVRASNRSCSLPATQPTYSPPVTPPAPLTPMAQRVQSWLSLNLPSSQQVVSPLEPTVTLEAEDPHLPSPALTVDATSSAPPDNAWVYLHDELPRIFDDMGEDVDSVVPDLPIAHRQEDSQGPAPYSVRSSMESVQVTKIHHPSKLSEVQSHEDNWRALVSRIQDRLDESTRVALQATMGLESCVVDMSGYASQRDIREVQAKMYRHLSALKEGLWQILLVSNDTQGSERISGL